MKIDHSNNINEKANNTRKLNNSHAQDSVLAPLLFSMCTVDIPITRSTKFAYAGDMSIITQHKNSTKTERILIKDLSTLGNYFHDWRLKPNSNKTEAPYFHLNNKHANAELNEAFKWRHSK